MIHQRSSLHLAALENAEVLQQKLAEIEAACSLLEPTHQAPKALLHQALQEAQATQASLQEQLRALNYSTHASTQQLAGSSDSDTGYPSPEIASSPSEKWFWQLFEESQDPTFILEGGVFIDCNQAAVKAMQGTKKSDLLSLNPVELSPEFQPDGQSSSQKANEMIATALSQGKHRFEWMYRRLDGADFWVEIQLTSRKLNGRQILHATLRDMSDRKAAEAELYEQEQLLRSTYEGVEYNIVIIDVSPDEEFRFIGWNPATEKHTGITSEFALGKTPEQLLGRGQGAVLRQNYQRCLNLGKSITYEEYVPLHGRDRWWLTTLNPLKNGQGTIYRIVLTTFEITDLKIAEAKLQQKEAQYRSVFEAMNDGILITNLDTGKLITANPAACDLFGYTYEEFVQLQASDYIHSDSLSLFTQFLETVRAGERFYCEAVDIRKDGTLIDVEVTGISFLYDGKPQALSVVRDISDRKATENALQETNSLLNSVLETIPGFFFTKDLDGRLVILNSNLAHFFGKPINEMIGKTDADLFPKDTATAIMLEDQEVMTQGVTRRFEALVPVRGVDHTYLIIKTPLRDTEGTIVGLIGLAQDISDRKAAEAELYQQQQLLRSTYEGVECIIVMMDISPDGEFRLRGWNPAATKQTGLASEVIVGKTPEEALGEETGSIIRRNLQSCLNKGDSITYEEHLSFQGQNRWWLTTLNPLKTAQGRIYRIVLTTIDITDRKATEITLQETNTLLNSVLETIPGFFFVKDRKGRHVAINSNLANFFGKSINDVIGKTDADLFPVNVAEAIMVKDQEIMTRGITQHFEEAIPTGGMNHTYLTVKTPLRGTKGKIIGLIGLAQDISDRKAMEVSLQQSEQRFRDVTEAAGAYIWEMSADGRYTFVTERVTEVKGYSPAELLGRSLFKFMPQADITHAASIIRRATVNKSAFSLESRSLLPSGDMVWESITGLPLLDEQGKITGFRGTGLSITERKVAETALTKKAEELEQTLQELQRAQLRMIQNEKMSSLGQLVAGVAHEINNPVSFIYSNIPPANQYTQALLHLINLYQIHYPDPLPRIRDEMTAIDLEFVKQDLPKILGSMKLGAERIRQIVGSLRTFSRLDEAECKAVDIHAGLNSTLVILSHRIKATSERPAIQVRKDYGEMGLVECYAGQLNQVFMNILANALDALEDRDRHRSLQDIQETPSSITILTRAISSDRIAIHISDNGPGMPKAVQQRVFDPFFTTKPVGQGTGMGMSISHQIITENHGGSIQCFSAPGKETEFIIEIPQHQSRA